MLIASMISDDDDNDGSLPVNANMQGNHRGSAAISDENSPASRAHYAHGAVFMLGSHCLRVQSVPIGLRLVHRTCRV